MSFGDISCLGSYADKGCIVRECIQTHSSLSEPLGSKIESVSEHGHHSKDLSPGVPQCGDCGKTAHSGGYKVLYHNHFGSLCEPVP